jgi:cholesterol transport system auxiliary component
VRYYAIELPQPPATAQSGARPVSILVGRITAPAVYRDTRIVYQMGATRMGTYEEHRWIDTPSAMLHTLLLRQLRSSGRFESVQPLSSNASGDYLVRGQLFEFTEVDSGGSVTARVSFELDLFEYASGKTVFSKSYSGSEPVSGSDVAAVVQAFDRSVRRNLADFASGLDGYFSTHPPEPKSTSSGKSTNR